MALTNYQNRIWHFVLALLERPTIALAPNSRAVLTKRFPGIIGMIEKEFATGSVPEYVAVMIAAVVLVDEIETVSTSDRRRLVLDQLRNVEAIEKSDFLRADPGS